MEVERQEKRRQKYINSTSNLMLIFGLVLVFLGKVIIDSIPISIDKAPCKPGQGHELVWCTSMLLVSSSLVLFLKNIFLHHFIFI